MDPMPQWVEHFCALLGEFVELESPGTIEWRFVPREQQLVVAPGLLELVGGAEDGEVVYPYFVVHLRELAEEFDSPPSLEWNTMHDELWVSGEMDGEEAFVILRKEPFADGAAPSHRLDGARLRRKELD